VRGITAVICEILIAAVKALAMSQSTEGSGGYDACGKKFL
jgi:hypothetical protein